MGEPFKEVLNTTSANDDLVNAGLYELGQLARQAFEDKRRKQSLAISNAILKIDPDNREAHVLQSWVRADLHQEFETAAALVSEARTENNPQLYERAERVLRSILVVDAENEEAGTLLSEVISEQAAADTKPLFEQDLTLAPEDPLPASRPASNLRRRITAVMLFVLFGLLGISLFKFKARDQLFPLQTVEVANPGAKAAPAAPVAPKASLSLFVEPLAGALLSVDDSPARPVPRTIELPAGSHRLVFTADGYLPEVISQTVTPGQELIVPVIMTRTEKKAENATPAGETGLEPESPSQAKPQVARRTPPPTQGARRSPPPTVERPRDLAKTERVSPRAFGGLALNSPAPVDVYLGGENVGTTPITLQLPPGPQTFEYRYQGFRKTASYIIKVNETTRASIVFEVDLEINATPAAQVSVEGLQRRVLGQTPLNNVRVPVGSVLLFQNSGFPEKRYVVTGNEKTVQVAFP